jgi:Ni,Fe-hydrogenase I cytochrome b subunit
METTNDNWRKRNWHWIAIACLIIGLVIGYFIGESVEEKYLYIQPIRIEEHPIMEK